MRILIEQSCDSLLLSGVFYCALVHTDYITNLYICTVVRLDNSTKVLDIPKISNAYIIVRHSTTGPAPVAGKLSSLSCYSYIYTPKISYKNLCENFTALNKVKGFRFVKDFLHSAKVRSLVRCLFANEKCSVY